MKKKKEEEEEEEDLQKQKFHFKLNTLFIFVGTLPRENTKSPRATIIALFCLTYAMNYD